MATTRAMRFLLVLLWVSYLPLSAFGSVAFKAPEGSPFEIAPEAPLVGTLAPPLSAKDHRGNPISTHELLGRRNLILVFYRGAF